MEHYQEAPSQILRAIRACVTQEGEWTTDLPWMSQPALTASDRGISNRLTGRKVAKASRLWVGHKKNGCHQPIFCVRCDKDVFRTRPVPRQTKGVKQQFTCTLLTLLPDNPPTSSPPRRLESVFTSDLPTAARPSYNNFQPHAAGLHKAHAASPPPQPHILTGVQTQLGRRTWSSVWAGSTAASNLQPTTNQPLTNLYHLAAH